MRRNEMIAVGAGGAVLLGLLMGVLFGPAGRSKTIHTAAPTVAVREPDSGLQVVVGPTKTITATAQAPAPVTVASAPPHAVAVQSVSTRATASSPAMIPAADVTVSPVSTGATVLSPQLRRVPASSYVAPARERVAAVRPARIPIPATAAGPGQPGADDQDEPPAASPPERLRPAPPLRQAPPSADPGDDEDDGPPPPPAPPAYE